MVKTPESRDDGDDFERRSRALFEASVERLDARTRSRLNQARHVALDELKKGSARRYWVGLPLGGLAAAALVAVILVSWRGQAPTQLEAAAMPLDDVDIVADSDNIELLQDVEFYSWLADQGPDSGSNTG
jgi:hypothetical protein